MSVATTLKIGQWRSSDDSFQPHPASPTGAIFDLNDGTIFSLVDKKGTGDGLTWSPWQPQAYTTTNPHLTGSPATKITHTDNRELAINLVMGQGTLYGNWIASLHNLSTLCAGITPNQPAALLIQPTGSSAATYADVVAVKALSAPYEELKWIQFVEDEITLVLTIAPLLRGQMQTLQNLCVNPGFEVPSGPAVTVFNDTLANFNAYTVQAGGALAQDTFRYPDTVKADAPLVYYRLDEASGANCYDASGNAETATYSNSPTLGATSLLTGDTDTAVTLAAASSQRVVIPVTNLPTGNSAMTIDGLIKITAAPGSTQTIFSYGAGTVANHNNLNIRLSTSAQILVDVGSSTLITSSAITTNAVHYVAVRWDGTTLTLNIDNAAKQTATPGNQTIPTSSINCYLGALNGGIQFLSATVDEWAIYGAALLDARISAHYTAATNAPTSTSNTMVIPASGRVSFGSPVWSNYNLWQIRWRWVAGLTAQFYLHYTDANDNVLLQMQSTTLTISSVVGGVSTTIATASNVVLTNGIQYWLQITQFPDTINLSVSLLADSNGAVGPNITTITGQAAGGLGSIGIGQPQVAASGAALAIGGNFSNVQRVQLFGPGGWFFTSTGTTTVSGAWEQTSANCYSGGVTTSYGAGRIDTLSGSWTAKWTNADTSSAARIVATAMPATSGQILAFQLPTKTNVGSGYSISYLFAEYNNAGTLLTTGTVSPYAAGNGNYSTDSGSYTVSNISTTLVVYTIQVTGTVAATFWFDTVQVWNETTTGSLIMPYCELRGPQGPFQWMVSGVLGDAPSPALLCLGTYETTWNTNAVRNYYCGRRLFPSAAAQLVGTVYGNIFNYTNVLDSAAYGGYHVQEPSNQSAFTFNTFITSPPLSVATMQGTFEVLARLQTTQTTGNIANVTGSTDAEEFIGVVGAFSSDVAGPTLQLFTAGSAWTPTDWGRVSFPLSTKSASRDLTTVEAVLTLNGADSTGGGSEAYGNWCALLPHDTEVLTGSSTNFSNAITNEWVWIYADGLIPTTAAWLISAETTALPNAAHAVAGPGSTTLGIRPNADTFMNLDPTQHLNGTSVNQGVALVTDNIATLFACYLEFKYVPLYFFPQ